MGTQHFAIGELTYSWLMLRVGIIVQFLDRRAWLEKRQKDSHFGIDRPPRKLKIFEK
jgi:hypothetical protein